MAVNKAGNGDHRAMRGATLCKVRSGKDLVSHGKDFGFYFDWVACYCRVLSIQVKGLHLCFERVTLVMQR